MAATQSNTVTQKRVYYYRLQTLLIDGGTEVIRNVLDQRINVPLDIHLQNSHNVILQIKNTQIIKQNQYTTLFTKSGKPNPVTSADLDITLLTCLLQHTCGLQKSTPKSVWFSTPAQIDTSLEAEIVRMRLFRNELAHAKSTALTQQFFSAKWNEIETVLLRLNAHCQTSNVSLQAKLDAYKTGTVDEEAQERYDQLLKDWGEMDKNVMAELGEITQMLQDEKCRSRAVVKEVTEMRENVEEIQHILSPRLEILKAVSEQHFNQMKENQYLFVRTTTYKKAWEKFGSGIAILSGYPGEGKTTMASQMLLHACPVKKILKLSTPNDWEKINVKYWNGVLIDDIFGSDALDEDKAKHWKQYLPEFEAAAHRFGLYVVITTRQNILKEASDRLSLDLFKEENVTILSSQDLSKEEKTDILMCHLKKNKRDESILNACISRWKDDE